jgi:hypothetical protein
MATGGFASTRGRGASGSSRAETRSYALSIPTSEARDAGRNRCGAPSGAPFFLTWPVLHPGDGRRARSPPSAIRRTPCESSGGFLIFLLLERWRSRDVQAPASRPLSLPIQ